MSTVTTARVMRRARVVRAALVGVVLALAAACTRAAPDATPEGAVRLFVECARALGKRAILEGGTTDAARLTYAFRLCVSRKPTADELAVLSELLKKHRQRFVAGEANAAEVATGEKEPKAKQQDGLSYTDWAAYTLVARVVLNLDETVTKE